MNILPLTKLWIVFLFKSCFLSRPTKYAAWCLRLRSWVCVTWNLTWVNLRHNSTTNFTVMCRWHLPWSVVCHDSMCLGFNKSIIKFHSCDKLPKENSKLFIILWHVWRKYTNTSEDTGISLLLLFIAPRLVLSEMQRAAVSPFEYEPFNIAFSMRSMYHY